MRVLSEVEAVEGWTPMSWRKEVADAIVLYSVDVQDLSLALALSCDFVVAAIYCDLELSALLEQIYSTSPNGDPAIKRVSSARPSDNFGALLTILAMMLCKVRSEAALRLRARATTCDKAFAEEEETTE